MKFVAAIDQGTSSTRVLVFDEELKIVAGHQVELKHYSPQPGWVEMDANEIMASLNTCIQHAGQSFDWRKLVSIGITNQRETTVVWDRLTGKPLYRAIVWLDVRNAQVCEELVARTGSRDYFRDSCGLPISTYFSAMKLLWLRQEVPQVREAMENDTCLFGTVESWILWNITGGARDGVHVTDVSNASRTMLMNLKTLDWDEATCDYLGLPKSILPRICSNSEVYGTVAEGPWRGIPVSGCIGDQQSAMLGQFCLEKGEAKNTYGTGCFLLMNTGDKVVKSTHGLLTTVCNKLGPDKTCTYALEGSIASGGVIVKWLRDNLKFFDASPEINKLASSVEDNGGVYFVPALSGLFAPHWRDDARGLIVGLTHHSRKEHICRAALEAICFRTREVLGAMEKDSGMKLQKLRVDGGMAASDLLLQLQADALNIATERPAILETTAMGAALAAGLSTGVWDSVAVARQRMASTTNVFEPRPNRRSLVESNFKDWTRAVHRSIGWAAKDNLGEFASIASRAKQWYQRPSLVAVTAAITSAVVTWAFVRRRG